MQHRKNKLLEISTGAKSKPVFLRQLLTNLVRNGKITTTPKRAAVLKAYADSFFAGLVKNTTTYKDAKDARRENIRVIKSELFSDPEGKKVIEILLPKFIEAGKKSGFITSYKLGYRLGDGAEKILLKLM